MTTFEFIEESVIESPVYESHKRGKNWFAVLEGKNSVDMSMSFQKMRGKLCSCVNLKPGMAVEFGGDYISTGGYRQPDRKIYVIESIDEKGVHCTPYETRAKAMKARFTETEKEQ